MGCEDDIRSQQKTPAASLTTRALIALALGAAALAASAESLYNESTFQSLTADRRALRPGDALTVLVVENASASASANTTGNKTGGLTGSVKASGGRGTSITPSEYTGSISLGEDFGGKGTVQRSGRVAAQLTVTVQSVMPNQEMMVAGRQQIFVNGEKQLIELSGRVRPVDVTDGNTVLSSRIADAEITYVGDGVLAEKQKQGLVSRVLSWLGLL
jgi:flagellar L-ring protein precursor FlgH